MATHLHLVSLGNLVSVCSAAETELGQDVAVPPAFTTRGKTPNTNLAIQTIIMLTYTI